MTILIHTLMKLQVYSVSERDISCINKLPMNAMITPSSNLHLNGL